MVGSKTLKHIEKASWNKMSLKNIMHIITNALI